MEHAMIEVLSGPLAGMAYPLVYQKMTVGRSSDCLISPEGYSELSRQHACFVWNGQGFTVQDLGSKNGVSVGGQSLSEAMLGDQDVASLGDFSFRLHIPEGGPEFAGVEPAPPAVQYSPQESAPRPGCRGTMGWVATGLAVAAVVGAVIAVNADGGRSQSTGFASSQAGESGPIAAKTTPTGPAGEPRGQVSEQAATEASPEPETSAGNQVGSNSPGTGPPSDSGPITEASYSIEPFSGWIQVSGHQVSRATIRNDLLAWFGTPTRTYGPEELNQINDVVKNLGSGTGAGGGQSGQVMDSIIRQLDVARQDSWFRRDVCMTAMTNAAGEIRALTVSCEAVTDRGIRLGPIGTYDRNSTLADVLSSYGHAYAQGGVPNMTYPGQGIVFSFSHALQHMGELTDSSDTVDGIWVYFAVIRAGG